MKFTKMHGCGNDYVYVNCFEEKVENPSEVAIKVSHRHFGVGADGLILIKPTDNPAMDAEMDMYNADGSSSEMCGNGLRCVAKYVYDHGITSKSSMKILTGTGPLSVEVLEEKDGKAETLRINMGKPELSGLKIPTTWDMDQVIRQTVIAGDREFEATCVSMGNPHCVIYVDDVDHFPVEKYGSILEASDYFPNRVNIEFIEIISPTEVKQRTWERGSGETWACGTGASAVCVAGVLTGKTEREILIHLVGGDLNLNYTKAGHVELTGPAIEVFTGEI